MSKLHSTWARFLLNSYNWVEAKQIAEARKRLRTSSYIELRQINCQISDGVLTLCGSVPRYHLKQHAYRIVADLAGVRRVSNDITVERYRSEDAYAGDRLK